MVYITIDKDKCDKCGICIEVCPVDIYRVEGDRIIADNSKNCLMCYACVYLCPRGAINHEKY